MGQDGVTLLARLRNPAQHDAVAALIRGAAVHEVPGLHFLSIFVIPPSMGTTEVWVGLEANFDGRREEFLQRLVAGNRALLDTAFRDCEGYTNPQDLFEYLRARDLGYQLYYVGCPGRTVEQIAEEHGMARNVDAGIRGLQQPVGRRFEIVREVFNSLPRDDRERVFNIPRRPFWVRLGLYERPWQVLYGVLQWLVFLIGIPTIVLLALGRAPASVVAATQCWLAGFGVLAGLLTLGWLLMLISEFPAALRWRVKLGIFLGKLWSFAWTTICALPGFVALLGAIAFLHWHLRFNVWWILLYLLAVALLAIFVAYWLALIGRREPGDSVDELTWDVNLARRRVEEDRGPQNHFISVTVIRPGRLRLWTLYAVLWGIHLLARVLHNPKGLFNTQSIHFARWTILPDRRLLFISNYDGSFGGYLGIFATLGAEGVSAIWGNTEDFPRTFLLFLDGARDEQRFKRRARASQVETLLWYRRYPDLTVAAIERNAAIREDLARFARDGEEAAEADYDTFLRRFSTPTP